jgi:ribosomal protein S4
MYGKKIKNLAYVNHKSKLTFNSKFGGVLCKLELRLNVLIIRMGFVNKLQQADFIISAGKCMINNITKHKRYSLSVGDLTSFKVASLKIRDLKRFKKLR